LAVVTRSLRAGSVLVVLSMALACGRIGYDSAPPVQEIQIRALDGTRMLQGETVRIEVTILPPEAAMFGRPVTLSAAPGRLNGMRPLDDISAPDDGGPFIVELSAGMDVQDGRMLILETDAPVTSGDLRYLVESGPMTMIDVGPNTYAVADGLMLEDPLPPTPELTGRSAALLMPAADSGFGGGPLVVAGDPFEMFDGSTGSLVPLSTSGAVPTSGRIAQAQLVYEGGEYGEALFVCIAGATGGLYSITAAAEITLVRAGGCNGVIRYGDFVYLHTLEGILMLEPTGETTAMITAADGLPSPDEGFFLGICPSQFLGVKMVLFSAGGAGIGTDGFTMAFEPWDEPRPWAMGLQEPVSAAYDGDLPFGTVMLVALFGGGELVALRDDGSRQVVVGGLEQPTSVATDADGGVWILDQAADRLLRLRRVE